MQCMTQNAAHRWCAKCDAADLCLCPGNRSPDGCQLRHAPPCIVETNEHIKPGLNKVQGSILVVSTILARPQMSAPDSAALYKDLSLTVNALILSNLDIS